LSRKAFQPGVPLVQYIQLPASGGCAWSGSSAGFGDRDLLSNL